MTGIGENTLAQPVKPPLRERCACLAKLVKNRLTLTRLTGRLDEASVAIAAARAEGGSISYDEPVDLGVYDAALEGVS